jgi:hypothetical protein
MMQLLIENGADLYAVAPQRVDGYAATVGSTSAGTRSLVELDQ